MLMFELLIELIEKWCFFVYSYLDENNWKYMMIIFVIDLGSYIVIG